MSNIKEDVLFIGYDYNKENGDIPVLSIGRYGKDGSVGVINHVTGDEAVELYSKLTGTIKIVELKELSHAAACCGFNKIRDIMHKSDITVAAYYKILGFVTDKPTDYQYGWKKGTLVIMDRIKNTNYWQVYFKEKPVKLDGGLI